MTPAVIARRRRYLLGHGDVRYFDGPGPAERPTDVDLTALGHEQASAATPTSCIELLADEYRGWL